MKNMFLLFASNCSQPGAFTTTPCPIACMSGKNSLSFRGTGAPGMFPNAAL